MEWEVSSGGGEEERRGEMPRDGGQRGTWDCKRVWHDLATGQQQQKSYREWRWNLPQVCEKGAPA